MLGNGFFYTRVAIHIITFTSNRCGCTEVRFNKCQDFIFSTNTDDLCCPANVFFMSLLHDANLKLCRTTYNSTSFRDSVTLTIFYGSSDKMTFSPWRENRSIIFFRNPKTELMESLCYSCRISTTEVVRNTSFLILNSKEYCFIK